MEIRQASGFTQLVHAHDRAWTGRGDPWTVTLACTPLEDLVITRWDEGWEPPTGRPLRHPPTTQCHRQLLYSAWVQATTSALSPT